MSTGEYVQIDPKLYHMSTNEYVQIDPKLYPIKMKHDESCSLNCHCRTAMRARMRAELEQTTEHAKPTLPKPRVWLEKNDR